MSASAAAPAFEGHALGLTVEADRRVLGLVPGAGTGGRSLALSSVERLPPLPDPRERLAELRDAAGARFLDVERHAGLGYRIEAVGHGCHLLSPDARRAACVPAVGSSWAWHLLFFAQVLPTAAALQGLEVLHASAVAVSGEATGIVSASGGGKSSVAAQMLAGGASFVTDDVLAIESTGGSFQAHPGPAFLSVEEAALARLPRPARALGRSDKVQVAVDPVAVPVPLRRLVVLHRDEHAGRVSLQRLSPPDPRLLLGAAFALHLTDRERLTTQLDTCAAMARSVECFRLVVPLREPATTAAEVLLES